MMDFTNMQKSLAMSMAVELTSQMGDYKIGSYQEKMFLESGLGLSHFQSLVAHYMALDTFTEFQNLKGKRFELTEGHEKKEYLDYLDEIWSDVTSKLNLELSEVLENLGVSSSLQLIESTQK